MDLNTKLNLNFKQIVIFLGVVLVCLVVGVLIYISSRNGEEVVVEEPPNRDLVVDSTPIDKEPEIIEQDETISRLVAYITNIRDLGTRIEYDIQVGLGENTTSSIVKANSKTVFYDFETKKIINPSDIQVGDNIVMYATGKYTIGDLSAEVLAKGSDSSYSYGKLTALNTSGEDSYIWSLDGGMDKLLIDSNCSVIDGYTGSSIQNIRVLQLDDKVLYKGTLEQTDLGNIYRCTEVITFGNRD